MGTTTHVTVGREKLAATTDEEVFALWNDHLETHDEIMKEHEHVAVEIPPGRPQLRYFEAGDQWVPRGDVLRCVVLGFLDDPYEPFLTIDDRDFTPRELAKMVGTFGGWGMRITFLSDDELRDEPIFEVREPDAQP